MTRIASIAILRLSAIGDCCHIVPVVHCLAEHFDCDISWIIGTTELGLFAHLRELVPRLNFIVYDKKHGFSEADSAFIANTEFSVLLNMHTALRAGCLSRQIRARRRIGLAWQQSREAHYLFCNEHIGSKPEAHFVDLFLSFCQYLGAPCSAPSWRMPAAKFAWPRAFIVLQPLTSASWKDWPQQQWLTVCQAILHHSDVDILLSGANSAAELAMAAEIAKLSPRIHNQVGKTNLWQLYAMISAAQLVLSADSAALHIASLSATPALGLYAATDPEQTGPYHSLPNCINLYPQAKQQFAAKAKFGARIKNPAAMRLISTDMVIAKLRQMLTWRG